MPAALSPRPLLNTGGSGVVAPAGTPPAKPVFDLSQDQDDGAVGDRQTSFGTVTLVGQTTRGAVVSIKGKTGRADTSGRFAVYDVPLAMGANKLTAVASLNGLTSSAAITVTRNSVPPGTLVLTEGLGIVSEATIPVTLGVEEGSTRVLRFDLHTSLSRKDRAASGDVLLVSLVDTQDPPQTLLGSRGPGSPLLIVSESGTEFRPGLVRFDGQTVEIEVTSVAGVTDGELRFQLLSADTDTGSEVHVGPVENIVTADSEPGPLLPALPDAGAPAGDEVTLSAYKALRNVQLVVENVRFDEVNKQITADLRLRNASNTTVGRNAVVILPGLPAGVTVVGRSGTTAVGDPYLTFTPVMPAGGLAKGETSDALHVVIDNPGLIRFALRPSVRGSANAAPKLAAVPPQTVYVGGHLELKFNATDANGDRLTFRLKAAGLPSGEFRPDGTLVVTPKPGEEGTYPVTVIADDGSATVSRSFTLTVAQDSVTTTRVSGLVCNVDGTPIAGVRVEMGAVFGLTGDDGSFLLDLGQGVPPTLTLKIRGELLQGSASYPFIAEKLPLLLEHDLYPGVNNVIGRPIYLPELDTTNAITVDPGIQTKVTTPKIPGLELTIPAGSLTTHLGDPYTGQVSITEVPRGQTPAALPDNLRPDTVVTIQPGEMAFTSPAPMTFPNRAGYAPGTVMDLWSINPSTGEFDDVGDMIVSADGQSIVTTVGGVRNSSWHFPAPQPDDPDDSNDDPNNEDDEGEEDKCPVPGASAVELHSGILLEDHSLITYQSLGQTRGLTLHYDSGRADPRPILTFGYSGAQARTNDRLVAGLVVKQGGMSFQVPGATAGTMGLAGGEHVWQMDKAGDVRAALQADFRTLPTGLYDYELTTGILSVGGGTFSGSTKSQGGKFQVVNGRGGAFGNGWGLGGLDQVFENPDGSLLLVDGNGSELRFGAPAQAGQPYQPPPGDFSSLVKLPNGAYRRTMMDMMVHAYDARGRLTSVTDRNTRETTYEYGTSGLTKITDPAGLATRLTYTGGRVTKITDPAGRATALTYDTAGNLIKVKDPDGATRTWGYDGDSRMTAETDARGFNESTSYDLGGRVAGVVTKDGKALTFSTLQTKNLQPAALTSDPLKAPGILIKTQPLATHTDADGHVTQTVLDKAGQEVSRRDSAGRLGSVGRNNLNLITSSLDGRGFSTEYEYDAGGNMTVVTDFVGSAEGGSLFVTGHDTDDHANGDYQRAGLDFLQFGRAAKSAAEIASRAQVKVGYLGNGNASQSGSAASGYTDRTFINLGNVNWADQAFGGGFDILMVGTGGDYVSGAGSAAMNAEADRFADFFNSGGGIFVNTDQGSVGQSFYNFLPRFGATQSAVGGGGNYTVTPAGLALGLSESIVDRDITHTEYQNVDTSLFTVFEIHNDTLDPVAIGLSRGIIGEGGFARATRKYEYDPVFSQVTKFTDGRDMVTTFDLDPATGNVAKKTRVVGLPDDAANGETDDLGTTYTYTPNGQVNTMTDALGRVTDHDYDAQGRLVKATYAKGTPDEAVRTYAYDLAGNQTSVTDENGHTTKYVYDAANRLKRTIVADPDGAGPLASPVTDYGYDFDGNLVTTVDPRGNVTRHGYDQKGRLISTTYPDPDGAGPRPAPVTRYAYDKAGSLVAVTDPLGQTTTHDYDSRGRRVATTDPDLGVTRFAYDTDDNLVKVVDPGGNVTAFAYDSRNRLIKETDPLGKATLYAYDADNNLVAKADRDGRKTEFAYDDLNRLTKETWTTPGLPTANVINYTYDPVGNLLAVADDFSVLAMTYDARDRVKSVSNAGTPGTPVVGLAYTYDKQGNVVTVAETIGGAGGATTAYVYDALDRLTRLTQTGGGASNKRVDLGYNALGQYTQVSRFAGTNPVAETAYTYDAMNRLTGLTHRRGVTTLAGFGYTYDSDSRITSINSVRDGVVNYTYDDRDQLTGANYATGALPDEQYAYDENGNRTGSHRHGTGYATDPNTANRLKSDGTFDYDYDDEGNMVKRTEIATGAVRDFTWDHRNRLTAVTDKTSGGVITQEVTFTYDALNRRISKTVNGTNTLRFVYDREDVLLDFADPDAAGPQPATLSVRYLHGPGIDQVFAEDRGAGNVRWLLTDHLGTTRDIINNAGVVLNHLVVDAYGNVLSQTNAMAGSRYVFTGRELDAETGLQYSRARYYDPAIGRFVGEDPIGTLLSQNLFQYVRNATTLATDPSGLSPDFKPGPGHINLPGKGDSAAEALQKYKDFLNQNEKIIGRDKVLDHVQKTKELVRNVEKRAAKGLISERLKNALVKKAMSQLTFKKVLTKFIPGVGWVMLAKDLFDIGEAIAEELGDDLPDGC